MDNEIISRQNEEKSIKCLAAQRQIYNEAKKFDNIGVIFSVVLPLLLSILQLFFGKNTYLNIATNIFSIISMFIGMAVESFITKQKNNAAMIQQEFDVYVYQMPWDDKLFGKRRDLSHLIAEKSKVLLEKTGEKEKLMNWYTPVVENVSKIKAIYICQKENFWWDVSLRKRYKKSCCIVIGISIVVVLLVGLINNESVKVLIGRIAFIVPMLQWLFTMFKQLNGDIENMQEIDELINCHEAITMDDLQKIQSKIFIHRKSCYAIPNFFYERHKNNDEDLAHRTAMLDN